METSTGTPPRISILDEADAVATIKSAGWTRSLSEPGKWWRGRVWATARAGIVDVKGQLSVAEIRAFATLAEALP